MRELTKENMSEAVSKNADDTVLIEITDLNKVYDTGAIKVHALKDIILIAIGVKILLEHLNA